MVAWVIFQIALKGDGSIMEGRGRYIRL